MKKLLHVIAVVFAFMMFYCVFEDASNTNIQNNYGVRLYDKGENLYVYNNVFFVNSIEERNTVIDELIAFADENAVEICASTDYTNDVLREVTDNYIYSNKVTKLQKVYFTENKEKIDFTSNDNRYYSNDSNDKKAYNHIQYLNRFYMKNNGKRILRFLPFKLYESRVNNLNVGVMFLSAHPYEDIENLKKTPLGKYINEDLLEIRSVEEEERIEGNSFNIYITLCICSACSLLLMIISYIYKKKHLISIMKLQGTANYKICNSIFGGLFFMHILLYFAVQVLLWWIFCGTIQEIAYPLLKNLFYFFIVFVFMNFLCYLFAYVFICRIQFSSAIKTKHTTNWSFINANMILKCSAVILISTGIVEIIPKISLGADIVYHYETKRSYLDNYAIYNNANLDTENDRQKVAQVYEITNKHGALLQHINELGYEENRVGTSRFIVPGVTVNQNFIKTQEYFDEEGNKINFDKYKNKNVQFVSKKRMEERENYTMPFFLYPDMEVVVVKSTGTMDTITYPPTQLKVKDPVIILKNVGVTSEDIGPNSYMIPRDDKNYESIQKDLKKADLENIISFSDMKNILDEQLQNEFYGLLKNLSIFIIYMICFLSVFYQEVTIYLAEFSKKIALRYLHGANYIQRYAEILLMNASVCIVEFILLFFFVKFPLHTILTYLGMLFIFELLILFTRIHFFQKNKIKQILKGDGI